MATRVTRDVVCDVCGNVGARRWTITLRKTAEQRTGDLCPDCEAALKPILEAFTKAKKGRQPKREVLTPEQIKQRRVKK